eukprot:4872008-Amphidinium_carterae.1
MAVFASLPPLSMAALRAASVCRSLPCFSASPGPSLAQHQAWTQCAEPAQHLHPVEEWRLHVA